MEKKKAECNVCDFKGRCPTTTKFLSDECYIMCGLEPPRRKDGEETKSD